MLLNLFCAHVSEFGSGSSSSSRGLEKATVWLGCTLMGNLEPEKTGIFSKEYTRGLKKKMYDRVSVSFILSFYAVTYCFLM